MTTTEQLQQIRANCVELLAIAEKRTQGKWGFVCPRRGRKFIWSGPVELLTSDEYTESVPADLMFISSCAGPAEAGWKATIAAIDFCAKLRRHYSHEINRMLGTLIDEQEHEIIAAWDGIV